MDPSLSDPHHPPPSQYTPFPTFPTSNNPSASGDANAPNHLFFGGQPVNRNPFNHVYQPQPQPQPQTPPSQTALVPRQASSSNPLSYTEMICGAIAAMNEPDGSSKLAITRYIERSNPNLPPAHGALMTHHLKSLKNSGVLTMVRKSYKLAGSSPPQSVAVAAAAVAAGLAAPRSELPLAITYPVNPVAVSASQPQKRGRGRPPKPKPDQQEQPINVQPISQHQPNPGLPSREQPQLPVTNPIQVAKRGPGRPRKDGSAPIPRAVAMKRRGRPLGRRASGRQRKPISVSGTSSVFPFVARRRGRPRRVESGGVLTLAPVAPLAPAVGQTVGIKRGRGRPPKIGGVMNKLITKPKQGSGRPVGRPRKNPTWPVTGATGTLEAAYGELKRKLDLASEKAKEILIVLRDGIASADVQAVAQARQELEGLIPMLTVEPQVIEEDKAEEAAPQTEAETQGEENGQERDGEGEQAQPQPQTQLQPEIQPQPHPQPQTEAEAMQEAMF